MIEFSCACGKTLRAPEAAQGRRARCPKCGDVVTVPSAPIAAFPESAPADEYTLREMPAARPPSLAPSTPVHPAPARAVALQSRREDSFRTPVPILRRPRSILSFSYILLLLALIPLVFSSFQKPEDPGDKLEQTVAAHPEIEAKVKSLLASSASADELFAALPNDRLDGSLLARDSHGHWLIALAAAAAYFTFLLVAFPNAPKYFKGLFFAGIFTGTAGVILLLFFQWAAFSLPFVMPRGAITLVLLIIKLIGYSYSLADGDTNFFLSFIGFTCGVGLCEEITKALPLLFRIRTIPGEEDPTWNSLLLWGLASGIGFGIAEGIMYSGRYYNGMDSGGIYLVRFISCVALHAMWAGAVGITLYRRQSWLHDADNRWTYFGRLIQIVLVPMILHGLYDTLLKKDQDLLALVVAVASFAWLTYQIESMARQEPAALAAA